MQNVPNLGKIFAEVRAINVYLRLYLCLMRSNETSL